MILLQVFSLRTLACTVLVVAASATEDGRPLLLKNRDSAGSYWVEMRVEQKDGYRYVTQYAMRDGLWEGPWGGFNETGFCVVNTLSYSYSGTLYSALNSQVIGMALNQCATVAEFEALIDGLEKPMDISANFGIIDAQGNAVVYEVGPNGYVKYDANDPQVAPDGILIRTNYSLTGDLDKKNGEDRWVATEQFITETKDANQLNGRYILQNLPRYLVNGYGTNLYYAAPASWDDETRTDFNGYIPRHSSTNAMLMQGVKEGEDPLMTSCWTMVGPPMTTVAVPLFLTPNGLLPRKVKESEGQAWLCEKGQQLKTLIFPYEDNATKAIDLSKLYNREETGLMQRIVTIEEEILERGTTLIDEAREAGVMSETVLHSYYTWLDDYIEREYEYNFENVLTRDPIIRQQASRPMILWDVLGRRVNDPSSYKGLVIGEGGIYIQRNR